MQESQGFWSLTFIETIDLGSLKIFCKGIGNVA